MMRLSFANFDPASTQGRPGNAPLRAADSSFEDLLHGYLQSAGEQRELQVVVEEPDTALPAGSQALLLQPRPAVHLQDVAEFLDLYATGEFVFSQRVLERIRELPEEPAAQPTADERRELRQTLSRGALNEEEQLAVLETLVRWGIVSKADVCSANTTVFPESGGAAGYLREAAGFLDVHTLPREDYAGRLQAMHSNEQLAYRHLEKEYGKQCGSILEYAAAHLSLHDALQTISR